MNRIIGVWDNLPSTCHPSHERGDASDDGANPGTIDTFPLHPGINTGV